MAFAMDATIAAECRNGKWIQLQQNVGMLFAWYDPRWLSAFRQLVHILMPSSSSWSRGLLWLPVWCHADMAPLPGKDELCVRSAILLAVNVGLLMLCRGLTGYAKGSWPVWMMVLRSEPQSQQTAVLLHHMISIFVIQQFNRRAS
ncbi:hypothetical protein Nepgr_003911 [Nepenthes gracilis]|uniref:Uncharacterized protein n=1 Tax=Nepenthes gracilis TaxID=150966 RepID=A0AAD3S0G2_NEPGR|nr:hypothetical protein Nepgr_003911 [Nepenthes gracilis]